MITNSCPICHHPLPDDFGLVTCSSCGASLFIEFDGGLHSYEKDSSEGELEGEELTSQNDSEQDLMQDSDPIHESNESSGIGDFSESLDSHDSELNIHQDFFESENSLLSESSEAEPENEAHQMLTEQWNEDEANESQGAIVLEEKKNLADMGELSAFGNSEQSLGRDGPLRVKVIVDGIDSPEIRDEIKNALTDKKLLWDVEGMMKSIESGCLIIENLNPLKAAIFVERIKGLPLDVRWEQFAINM